ncbi:MAG: TetR/AcrR family transcriptional regulator [Burkholderiales bacterium]|nr:TetR/AcrR family transcriptional regulator [Burkholderiales bacterium]
MSARRPAAHAPVPLAGSAPAAAEAPAGARRRYNGLAPQERQRLRRLQLLAAGLAVFGRRGYHGATVREVCATAQLTERYFYESFESLAALFAAVYAELREQLMARVMAALGHGAPDAFGVLEAAMRAFLEFIREDAHRGRVMLLDALAVDPATSQQSDSTARDYAALLKRQLERLLPPELGGQVSTTLLADGMVGLNIWIATRWMEGGFREPLETVLRTNLLPYRGLRALVPARGRPA